MKKRKREKLRIKKDAKRQKPEVVMWLEDGEPTGQLCNKMSEERNGTTISDSDISGFAAL